MSEQELPTPCCDLCNRRGKGIKFYPEEGVWLCTNSRRCVRRFYRLKEQWEMENLRYEPIPDEDIPW